MNPRYIQRNAMKFITPVRLFLFTMFALVATFSCEANKDQLEQTRNTLGEPDIIIPNDFSTFESEIWVYARRDINRVYEFRRSVGTCGGDGKWYLNQRFLANGTIYFDYELYDPPPVITHEPVVSAPVGRAVTIFATIELSKSVKVDNEITGATLFYRVVGDSLDTSVSMAHQAGSDSVFAAQIPAETFTLAGVEYYITACSNDDTSVSYHWSRLPVRKKKDTYFRIAVTEAETVTGKAGYTVSSDEYEIVPRTLPEPGDGALELSPISQ